jgi:hypothetical protein
MTTAEHESAHASAALLLRLPVLAIDVVGDGVHRAGWTRHGTDKASFQGALKYALVLCAPAAVKRGRAGFDWPLDPSADLDTFDLAKLFARKRWNRGVVEVVVDGVCTLVSSDRFRQLYAELTRRPLPATRGARTRTPSEGPTVISIPSPFNPSCIIVRARRDEMEGPSLKEQLSPEEYAVIERELDREEARQSVKAIMSGLHVSIREFDC